MLLATSQAWNPGIESYYFSFLQGKKKGRIARASTQWLDVRVFSSTAAAVEELRTQGYTIWATDLNPGALSLADSSKEVSCCASAAALDHC